MFKKLLLFKFAPANIDAGLLALRIVACVSIFIKHGYVKLFHFSTEAAAMNSRGHAAPLLGITLTVLIAAFGDGFCSLLMLLGFATRWAALYMLGVLSVAWGMALHFAYFPGTPGTDYATATHGEMIVAYCASMLLLVCAGAGRYSIDRLLDK
jgi:putative oxidoreductase